MKYSAIANQNLYQTPVYNILGEINKTFTPILPPSMAVKSTVWHGDDLAIPNQLSKPITPAPYDLKTERYKL